MSKILQTQLPTATGPLSPEIFNRLVRILELNLGPIDTDNTRQVSIEQRGSLSFNPGSIIWNTTLGVLQVWTGSNWVDIGERIIDEGYQVNAYLGKVTINIAGSTIITL
tara:strand:+ start:520 stop:846 length:327 start_codon:yes stop_codon:yes gene_type:complete